MRLGSLAPLVELEELHLFGNNLEALPTLAAPRLRDFKMHKNRVEKADDEYFKATPALEYLSLWGNSLTSLPGSLSGLDKLKQLQIHENKLTSLLPPGAKWPASLEVIFLGNNPELVTLPPELTQLTSLQRFNCEKLPLDADGKQAAEGVRQICLKKKDGFFWGVDGRKQEAERKV